MTHVSVAHAAVGGEGLAPGQEGDQLSRWEVLGALRREQVEVDGAGSVLFCSVLFGRSGRQGLLMERRWAGRRGESRMSPRFWAEPLGRWWHRLEMGSPGEEGQVFGLCADIRPLCKPHPPGPGLGTRLCGAHPGRGTKHPQGPSWLNEQPLPRQCVGITSERKVSGWSFSERK